MDSRLSEHAGSRRMRAALLVPCALAMFSAHAIAGEVGSGASPGAANGRYNVVGITERLHAGGFVRATASGELRLNSRDSSVRLEYRADASAVSAVCRSNAGACARRFVRHDEKFAAAYEGQIDSMANGIATVRVTRARDTSGAAVPESVRAFVGPGGDLLIVPIEHADGTTLLFATRRPSHSAVRLKGNYALSARDAQMARRTTAQAGAWSSHSSVISEGALSINHWYLAGHESGSSMQQHLLCAVGAGGCSAGAVLDREQLEARTFAGFAGADRRGAVKLTWSAADDRGESASWQGVATPDGGFLALLETTRAKTQPPQSLALAVRPLSGASTETVAGVFNAIAVEEFFDSDSGVRLAYVNGAMTFDAAGNWSFSGTDSARKRTECLASAQGCPGALVTSRAVQGGAGGTYVAGSRGTIAMDGLAGDNTPRRFVGEIADSGSVMVLRRVGDNEACSFDCTGLQSFRSLIIAIRRPVAAP